MGRENVDGFAVCGTAEGEICVVEGATAVSVQATTVSPGPVAGAAPDRLWFAIVFDVARRG